MNKYILIVDVLEDDGEHESHALYFESENGDAAQDYANLWMYTQYGDDFQDSELMLYELFLIRTVGSA